MSYMHVDFGPWLETMHKHAFIIFSKNISIKD